MQFKTVFGAAALASALTLSLQAVADTRITIDHPNQAPFSAIKPLMLDDGNCTLQFGPSKQVATTAAHCFDMIILGIDKFAAVRDSDGSLLRVKDIYIPEEYNPQDTSSKLYYDKAIVVLERPVSGPVNTFNLKAVKPFDEDGNIPVTQAGYPADAGGTLKENASCSLLERQFHKNGKDFVLHHNCTIAPGDSGSAVWDNGSNSQRAIVNSLIYAVPVTEGFISAYQAVADKASRPVSGFIKTGYGATSTKPLVHQIKM